MTRIGFELVKTKKQALQAAVNNKEGSTIEKSNISGRDLLSRLLAANMATDLPENQRLSDHDVFSRVSISMLRKDHNRLTSNLSRNFDFPRRGTRNNIDRSNLGPLRARSKSRCSD